MDEPPPAADPKPCCVCGAPGKQCTKCKSRHYCSRACQLVDWNERGHKAQCKRLAADFQDRMLDALTPERLTIEEAPGTSGAFEDVAPADGSTAARAPAVRTALVKAASVAPADMPGWRRGTCAICFDPLPFGIGSSFYVCCCEAICTPCSNKCRQHDARCPLCRAPTPKSVAEMRRLHQKHADEGNAEAQVQLGGAYRHGGMGLKKSSKRAVALYELAAAQGHSGAQAELGSCHESGDGVKINYKAAVLWYRRAADQKLPGAQYHLGKLCFQGKGVPQSYEEAARWLRLAAEQDFPQALYRLGACHQDGHGVPQDLHAALRLFERAAAKGCAEAAEPAEMLKARLAASRRPR